MTNRQVRFATENIEHEIKVDEHSDDEFSPSGDDESSPSTSSGAEKRQFNKFELLQLVEGDGDIDANSDDEDCEDGGDDAAGTTGDSETDGKRKPRAAIKQNVAPDHNNSKSSGKRKQRKRRSKGKTDKSGQILDGQQQRDYDELDNLARAIYRTSASSDQTMMADELKYKLLKVDMRNLVPETEIKRIFGKSVVKEDRTRLKHHPGLNMQRSRLVSSGYFEAKSTAGSWPGPRMELDDEINTQRIGYTTAAGQVAGASTAPAPMFNSSQPIYFKFVHDDAYQEIHRFFLDAVHQGNSEFIVHNLEAMPTHTESLIQLSHMLRVSEDYKASSEFIERALVVFERGFHPRFNLATGTCRLSYKRPENRTFFITIFKHINACHRRGLRRTPFEYSKLLLSLEPDNDPLMAVLLLDFFAIRSEEYDFIIDFYTQWQRIQRLPNLKFALAMAHFLKSRDTKRSRPEQEASLKTADECLREALLLFPNFLNPLLDACSGEPDAALKQCNYFDYSVYSTKYKLVPETVDVLVTLYVKRTYSLWKQKHVLAWLERNIAEMVAMFATGQLVDEARHTRHWSTFTKVCPKNLLRHVVLCDLGVSIPPSASASSYIDLDPYPPTDSIISYDASLSARSTGSGAAGSGGSLFDGLSGLFFRSILPSFSLAQQETARPASPVPTTSRGARRNRPPQRATTGTAGNEATTPGGSGARVAASATIDDGFDLDYDSIEYSLLIDAIRDLPGPNLTHEESAPGEQPQTSAATNNSASGGGDGGSGRGGPAGAGAGSHEGSNQLRRRQAPP